MLTHFQWIFSSFVHRKNQTVWCHVWFWNLPAHCYASFCLWSYWGFHCLVRLLWTRSFNMLKILHHVLHMIQIMPTQIMRFPSFKVSSGSSWLYTLRSQVRTIYTAFRKLKIKCDWNHNYGIFSVGRVFCKGHVLLIQNAGRRRTGIKRHSWHTSWFCSISVSPLFR